jgi:hypothetical protein
VVYYTSLLWLVLIKFTFYSVKFINLILYLFNEDCQQPMATSGFPQDISFASFQYIDQTDGCIRGLKE